MRSRFLRRNSVMSLKGFDLNGVERALRSADHAAYASARHGFGIRHPSDAVSVILKQ